ncbi:IspD/TarI family cytidylyltransferase [Nocardioides nematodiphilus]|uniref:IspD/TarI family cytidylyltransferase n=1 Tax=Nocardioides nematodiphilus TaxID=2849669 RepID=UPI001CD92599|nr:2-C-methyl-D-erythritol 4-phosphate cytidylyltransferase [Nocardioides nematodiphilus]MCA1984222.1 2-C-methyl-D-erythritol 4-phosphate cytidylyltransferase [Nocardioides nematodiphilus]
MTAVAALLLADAAEDLVLEELAGRPVLAHTLEHFTAHPDVEAIVIVTSTERAAAVTALAQSDEAPVRAVIVGGPSAGDSILRGLRELHTIVGDEGIVLIHQAARPAIDAALISANIATARERRAAVSAEPFADSVVWAETGTTQIHRVPPRRELHTARYPQTFRLATILDLYTWAQNNGVASHDPAQLCAIGGVRPSVVPSTPMNLRITSALDLAVVEAVLSC